MDGLYKRGDIPHSSVFMHLLVIEYELQIIIFKDKRTLLQTFYFSKNAKVKFRLFIRYVCNNGKQYEYCKSCNDKSKVLPKYLKITSQSIWTKLDKTFLIYIKVI